MPIRFGTDGMLAGEAGELAPILGAPKDRGRWWVDGDKLCSKFFRWFDAEPHCITVARDGSRLYWRKDNGDTGTATIVEQQPAAPAQPATVVAKAEPPPARKEPASAPKEASVPQEKSFVTASAAAAPAPAPDAAASPAQPTVAAKADAASQQTPGMAFGAADLADASTRAALSPVRPLDKRGATAPAGPKKDAPPRAAQAKPEVPKKPAPKKDTTVALLPPQDRAEPVAPRRAPTASEMYAAEEARARETALSRSEPAPRYRVRGVLPGDVLNVRRGPSEYHEQIASIPPTGRSVEITGRCYADWCPVRYGKVRGWVNSYYLTAEGTRVGSSSPVYTAKP